MEPRVLVVYDGDSSRIDRLASAVAAGVGHVPGVRLAVKHVRQASRDDLLEADAIILGSPNWSGVTGSLKSWLDEQGDLWEEGKLATKLGAAFVTSRGRHSGLEFTLLSLIHWMLACGMMVVGLPWSQRMRVSGSYYGATATGEDVQEEDMEQARVLGRRVADLSLRLNARGPV